MLKLIVVVIISTFTAITTAQTPVATMPLPERLTFWLYPDSLNGRRGHRTDIVKITQAGERVFATVTMHGVGQDKCRLQAQPAEGTFDGSKLVLKIRVDAGDNLTCPTEYELVRDTDGQFGGRYRNSAFTGIVRRE